MLKEEIYKELKAIKYKIDIEVDCPQMVNYERNLTGEQAVEWLEKLEALSAGSKNDIQGCSVWIYDSKAVDLQPEGVEMPLKSYLFNVTDYDVYTVSFELGKVGDFNSLDDLISKALDNSNCYGVEDCSLEASEVTEDCFNDSPLITRNDMITRIDISRGKVFVKMVNYIVDFKGEFYDDFDPFQMIELCGEKLTRAEASIKFQELIDKD